MKRQVLTESGRAMLAAEVIGSGDPIVFLHARVADRRMWDHQMREFGNRHQSISYDRRGFGETVAGAEDHSAVDDLMSVLNSATNGSPAILVASSQGGGVALDAALQYPSYVRALVLISSSVSGAPQIDHSAQVNDLIERLKRAEANDEHEEALEIRTHLWLDGPFHHKARVMGEPRMLFEEMNATALSLPPIGRNTDASIAYGRLNDVSVPTLVLCGDLDLPGIQERSRYIAMNVPCATLHQISGTAHLPSLERPLEVTRVIANFLDRSVGEKPERRHRRFVPGI